MSQELRDHKKITNDLANTITMMAELLALSATWN
jgi:hypothetical protein